LSATDVLARLNAFLDNTSPRLAGMFYRKWGDMRDSITYAELAEAIRQGEISKQQVEQWRQDYSSFIATKYAPLVRQGIADTAKATLARYGGKLFDPMSNAMERFITERGAFLAKEITLAQRDAINMLVRQAALTDTMTVDELARAIRPCIGLTKQQAQAAYNYYEQRRMDYYKQYVESGMSEKAAATKAAKEALARQATYESKLHRRRAASIAETELAFAYNNGMEEVIRGGIREGLFPSYVRRKWSTSLDERVCPKCGALDGVIVGMDDNFPGGIPLPPAHPGCRCAVEYLFGLDPQEETPKIDVPIREDGHFDTDYLYGNDVKYALKEQRVDATMKLIGADEKEAREMVNAINDFSKDDYKKIRQAQDENLQNEYRAKADLIEKYIDLAPNWEGGALYRGIPNNPNYAVGEVVDMKGVSSWSSLRSVADKFSRMDGFVFKVESAKKGTSINHLSLYMNQENEVICSALNQYKVTNIYIDEKARRTIIELTEL